MMQHELVVILLWPKGRSRAAAFAKADARRAGELLCRKQNIIFCLEYSPRNMILCTWEFLSKGENMKKTISILVALMLCACVYKDPLDNGGFYSETDLATVDWSTVNKSGRACQTSLFGIIPFGDNSVPKAVEKAKIQKLVYVDTDYILYFPILSRSCTNVWGVSYGDTSVTLPKSENKTAEKATDKPTDKANTEKTKK